MRLRHNIRNDDTISRFGGDEFLCVLSEFHEKNEIAMIAAKILKATRVPCDVRLDSHVCGEAEKIRVCICTIEVRPTYVRSRTDEGLGVK